MSSNSEICKARTLFITRGILNREIIPTEIIYSWVRSKLHNISFELLDIKNKVKSLDILSLDIQGSSIIKYLRSIKSEDSIVYLSTDDGSVIFNIENVKITLPKFTSLAEESIGTNAGGISVITKEGLTVKGCEHYNKLLVNFISSSIVIPKEKGSESYIITVITPFKLISSHERLFTTLTDHFTKDDQATPLVTEKVLNKGECFEVNPVKTMMDETETNHSEMLDKVDKINGCKVFTLSTIEKNTIEEALSHFKWNLKRSAEALGIGRSTLYRKIKEYNLKE
ncbi:MAG: helix-turn-helix domain-containing protein [Clostridiales bacterium]|nr:helix-turn-helix domain-containing protein [Clostridiales bacterium]